MQRRAIVSICAKLMVDRLCDKLRVYGATILCKDEHPPSEHHLPLKAASESGISETWSFRSFSWYKVRPALHRSSSHHVPQLRCFLCSIFSFKFANIWQDVAQSLMSARACRHHMSKRVCCASSRNQKTCYSKMSSFELSTLSYLLRLELPDIRFWNSGISRFTFHRWILKMPMMEILKTMRVSFFCLQKKFVIVSDSALMRRWTPLRKKLYISSSSLW